MYFGPSSLQEMVGHVLKDLDVLSVAFHDKRAVNDTGFFKAHAKLRNKIGNSTIAQQPCDQGHIAGPDLRFSPLRLFVHKTYRPGGDLYFLHVSSHWDLAGLPKAESRS